MLQQKEFVDFAYNPVMENLKEDKPETKSEDPDIEIIGELNISARAKRV